MCDIDNYNREKEYKFDGYCMTDYAKSKWCFIFDK